jgi:hypothetical protein
MVIAALWFAIHYAVFANLGSPWKTPLYVLSLFGL